MEHGGGGGGQKTQYAKADKRSIETDNEPVVILDAAQQGYGQLPQLYQFPQAVSGQW